MASDVGQQACWLESAWHWGIWRKSNPALSLKALTVISNRSLVISLIRSGFGVNQQQLSIAEHMGCLHTFFGLASPFSVIGHPVFDESMAFTVELYFFIGEPPPVSLRNHWINDAVLQKSMYYRPHQKDGRIFTGLQTVCVKLGITVVQLLHIPSYPLNRGFTS